MKLVPRSASQVPEREDAIRKLAGIGGCLHRLANDFGDTGVRVVGFDNHRTASSKCRSRISASDGEGEGKIAGAENRDRPHWFKHGAGVRFGHGNTIWLGAIYPGIDP